MSSHSESSWKRKYENLVVESKQKLERLKTLISKNTINVAIGHERARALREDFITRPDEENKALKKENDRLSLGLETEQAQVASLMASLRDFKQENAELTPLEVKKKLEATIKELGKTNKELKQENERAKKVLGMEKACVTGLQGRVDDDVAQIEGLEARIRQLEREDARMPSLRAVVQQLKMELARLLAHIGAFPSAEAALENLVGSPDDTFRRARELGVADAGRPVQAMHDTGNVVGAAIGAVARGE